MPKTAAWGRHKFLLDLAVIASNSQIDTVTLQNKQLYSNQDVIYSSNSQINTETLQNKQLYSNQDVIYREQIATLYWEKAQMLHAYNYSKDMRMNDL